MTPPDKHYLYGRVRLDEPVLKNMINRDGIYQRRNDDGSVEFAFYVVAANRLEAREVVRSVRAFEHELKGLGDDLEHYIDCFDFSRPGGTGDQEECLPHREES